MKNFPDFKGAGFNMTAYNERFKKNNVIIHAKSADVAYPEHWGCLSIKCAFRGNEYYHANNTVYAVNDNNYLILNEGQSYSSYIFFTRPVESFTINFSALFAQTVMHSVFSSANEIPEGYSNKDYGRIEFIEKLYSHDAVVSPVIRKLYELSTVSRPDEQVITETYYVLMEALVLLQANVSQEIEKVKALKTSTRKELYKRLHYAKNYIEACYMENITVHQLAAIACLNEAYFLRQFKKYFLLTPYQYLIQKRLNTAKHLLETTDMPIMDICFSVGYSDTTSFIKLFKRQFSLSPEKYQAGYRKKSFFTR